jgi:hypothetical protein
MNLKCHEYEWNFDETNGKLTCKRHGLTWRDETGDGAVLALLQVACEYKEKLTSPSPWIAFADREPEIGQLAVYQDRINKTVYMSGYRGSDKLYCDYWMPIPEIDG